MAITKALSVLVYTMICLSLATAKCPMNFEPLKKAEWINSTLNCTNFKPNNKTSIPYNPNADCCHIIKSLFKIALARYFSETEHFFLHNITTSKSCVQEFQSNVLPSLGFPQHLVSSCTLDPSHFAASPHRCAGIETLEELNAKLYHVFNFIAFLEAAFSEEYCQRDIYDMEECWVCQGEAQSFQNVLDTTIGRDEPNHDPHGLPCSKLLMELYMAGYINLRGPESYGVASCIFKLFNTLNDRKLKLLINIAGFVASIICIYFRLYYIYVDNKKQKNS